MDFDVISPSKKEELLKTIDAYQDKEFLIGAGYTDLINILKDKPTEQLTIINIAQLDEPAFSSIVEANDTVDLGTLVTASDLMENEIIKSDYRVLYEAAENLASIQIRNAATIGGNICNASPAADLSAALVALESVCNIVDSNGVERQEKLVDFIQGVRKISLSKNEILQSVSIPKNTTSMFSSGFKKVGVRRSMEIAIVSLAYHFQYDGSKTIEKAGVSVGAVAPVIPFALSACDFLIGKNIRNLSEQEKNEFSKLVLDYARPISDIRASAWYRKEVLANLAKSIFE